MQYHGGSYGCGGRGFQKTLALIRHQKDMIRGLEEEVTRRGAEEEVKLAAAEQENIKLRAEAAQRDIRDRNMVTLEAANVEIKRRVEAEKERVTVLARAEMKRIRGEASEESKRIQEELDDANEEVRLGKEEKKLLEAAKDAAEVGLSQEATTYRPGGLSFLAGK